MIQTNTYDTDHLLTEVNNFRPFPLVVPNIPLASEMLHLVHVVWSQGEMLEVTMCSDCPRHDEVLQT